MSTRKAMIIALTVGLIKRISLYQMSQYFPEPYECSGGNVNLELDLSNYATKGNIKGVTGVDKSNLVAKSDLTSLIAQLDADNSANWFK